MARKWIVAGGTLSVVAALALSGAPAVNAESVAVTKLDVALNLTGPTKAQYNLWLGHKKNKNAAAVKRWNFNWNTNGCSAPSFTPKVSTWNILFAGPCARHDFGYRNVKPLSGKDWKKKYKKRTDQSFLKDMQRICDGFSGVKKVTCKAVAATYFTVVDDWAS